MSAWEEVTLADLEVERIRSIDPRKSPDENFVLYSIPGHDRGRPEELVGSGIGSAKKETAVGRVLLSGLNPRINRVRIVDADSSQRRLLASTEWYQFEPEDGLSPHFLAYQLQQEHLRQFFAMNVSGVGGSLTRLRASALRDVVIAFPSTSEQESIIDAIETYFSRLDAAVASLQRATANVKRARASVLQTAVGGHLVPTEVELARFEGRDYEPASTLVTRILSERKAAWAAGGMRGKYKEPVAPAIVGLPELPRGWCWATTEQLTLEGFTNGLYVPKTSYGEGIPILRIDDFQDGWSRDATELRRVRIDPETAERYALKPGQLVVNRVNSMTHLGKCLAIKKRHTPSVFESNMMRAMVHAGCNVDYLTLWFRSKLGRRLLLRDAKWAVNQASINQADVGKTPVALPPLAEQHRIVAEVHRLLSVLNAVGVAIDRNLNRCARLRQAILQRAFEGRLVPAAEAVDDQPAST